jgi:hypothetical protein
LARHLFVKAHKGLDISRDQTCGCKFHGLILSLGPENGLSGLNSNTQPVAINLLTSTPGNIAGHTIDVVTIGGNTVVYANASGSSESISTHHQDMQINLTGVSPNLTDFILHH